MCCRRHGGYGKMSGGFRRHFAGFVAVSHGFFRLFTLFLHCFRPIIVVQRLQFDAGPLNECQHEVGLNSRQRAAYRKDKYF